MNCPICGGAYILGSDTHASCRELQKRKDQDLEELYDRVDRLEDRVRQLELGY